MGWKRDQQEKERFMKRFFRENRLRPAAKPGMGQTASHEKILWPPPLPEAGASASPGAFGAGAQN